MPSFVTTACLTTLCTLGSTLPIPTPPGSASAGATLNWDPATRSSALSLPVELTATDNAGLEETCLAQVQIKMPGDEIYGLCINLAQDEELVKGFLALGVPLRMLAERGSQESSTIAMAQSVDANADIDVLSKQIEALITQSNSLAIKAEPILDRLALPRFAQWAQYIFTGIAGGAGIIAISVAMNQVCEAIADRRRNRGDGGTGSSLPTELRGIGTSNAR